jgi:hypothetical protein
MLDRALEQISDGGEIDVRMGPNVHALASRKASGAELIDEDERPDHRPLARGQAAVDLEGTEIMRDGSDGDFDSGIHGLALSLLFLPKEVAALIEIISAS